MVVMLLFGGDYRVAAPLLLFLLLTLAAVGALDFEFDDVDANDVGFGDINRKSCYSCQ